MAIDTAAKRQAALVGADEADDLLPAPDASVDTIDRSTLVGFYLPSGTTTPTGAGDVLDPVALALHGVISYKGTANAGASGAFPADAVGITTETNDNPDSGIPAYQWVAFPAGEHAVMAWGFQGEAFPRVVFCADPAEGWFVGDGTFDPYVESSRSAVFWFATNGTVPGAMTLNVNAGSDMTWQMSGGLQVHSDGDAALIAGGEMGINAARLGFFGATAVARPAAPTTLADVIAALKALGLVAT